MNFIDFQHFGVHGPSRNINDPLGISMVSAMGAGVPIFYYNLQIPQEFKEFYEIPWIPVKFIYFL